MVKMVTLDQMGIQVLMVILGQLGLPAHQDLQGKLDMDLSDLRCLFIKFFTFVLVCTMHVTIE